MSIWKKNMNEAEQDNNSRINWDVLAACVIRAIGPVHQATGSVLSGRSLLGQDPASPGKKRKNHGN
jgi:hypothetical protein